MTADELLQEYRKLAIVYGEAGEVGDPRTCNAAYDQLRSVQLALRDLGQERRILELLDDESEHVRLWAGFDALYFSPHEGLRVIRELEQTGGREVGMHAWSILQEWESGDLLLLPWVDET